MRVTLALGVAFAAMTMAAYAEPDQTRVFIHHGGRAGDANMDADHDGWLSRAEAAAAAERMFAAHDSNNDGRLNAEDHPRIDADFDIRIDGPGGAGDENCTTTVEPPESSRAPAGQRVERRVTVICTDDGEAPRAEGGERRVTVRRNGDHEATETETEENGERRVERHVTIIRGGDGAHGAAPTPPAPPHPPMAMMMFMHSEESDLNGDGALSRDEFRAQQLRFFDASDVNGDGRVRSPSPMRWEVRAPAPPQAPEPPTPPTPPRRQ